MKNHFLLVSSGQQKRSYFFVLYCLIDLINNQYNPSIRHMISRLCGEISLNGKIMLLVQVDMDTCTQPITSTGVLPSNQVPVLSLLLCDISSLFSHSFNAVSIETEGRRRRELTSSAQSLYGTGRWAAGYLETQADSSDYTHLCSLTVFR